MRVFQLRMVLLEIKGNKIICEILSRPSWFLGLIFFPRPSASWGLAALVGSLNYLGSLVARVSIRQESSSQNC